ncbi:MAG: DUF4956 domain-containing protein, partial [Erysipelotrichales bacterium]|nr:DUF4956 domain-containing protein [Erysipelotrichales bacterium]
ILLGFVYMLNETYSKSFVKTLAMIPAMVAVVIMMVNGSLGASVAVAGTFSLVRFRSAPGTAKEIGWIFLSMAAGLACGMGYPAFAALFVLLMCLVDIILTKTGYVNQKNFSLKKTLLITVPEDLEYETMFEDLMKKYTTEWEMLKVKTSNLGSLNRLTYNLTLRKAGTEKAFMDELRTRNGNLEIALLSQAVPVNEL